MTTEVAEQSWTVPNAVAACLAAEGVDRAFGLMGAGTIAITHHLQSEFGVRYHAVRHESAVVGAADGYARATGRLGVGLVTWGPGVTNTVTSLITAQRAASPLILVAGDATNGSADRFPLAAGTQGLDQVRFFENLGVPTVRVSTDHVAENVHAAVLAAWRARGPVALLLPIELLLTQIPQFAPAIAEGGAPAEARVPLNPEQVRAAAALLRSAQRPVVLAGRGVHLAGGREQLIELADRVGAVVVTTLRGLGLAHGHPAHLGIAGGFAPDVVADLLNEADVVAAFGASMNRYTTRLGTLFPNAALIQCDTHEAALDAIPSAEHPILGDALEALDALLADLGDGQADTEYRKRAERLTQASGVPRHPIEDMSDADGMDPRSLCVRLSELLPFPRSFVLDVGGVTEFPVEFLEVRDPDELMCMFDFGAVGSGLGAAIGAALARPDRLTTLMLGDGGLLMTLGELDTAVRERVPLLVVCMNNRSFGSERYHMLDWGIPEDGAFFDTPDLAHVARSLGCEARRIESLDELDEIPALVGALDGPLVLDCQLTGKLIPAPMRNHS
jgi:thiamine pyrophosphate-dependent acetolactate synthase large subunit-like protein